jgi:PAS domain S-box-containing protein
MMSLTIVFGMVGWNLEPIVRQHRTRCKSVRVFLPETGSGSPAAVLSAAATWARLACVPAPASSEPTKIDVVEELPVAVVVTDHAGRIVELNGASVALLGHPREVCLGRTLVSFAHHQPFEGAGPAAPLAGTDILPGRARLLRSDGSFRAIEETRRTLADGRAVHVLHDVTAAAREADALRESERQLKFVANTVPALLAFVDASARYVWVNESYRSWFGLAPEEIRGRHVRDVLGEAPWEQVRHRIARALAGETVVFDNRALYQFGPSRDVHAAYVPHRDASGHVDGLVVLVTDVGEIKNAERARRRSEHMLAESQIAAHVGSWEAELDGEQRPVSLRWSDEAYRLFGWAPGVSIDHKRFIDAVHPEDREAVLSAAKAGIARGERFEKDYRIVRSDGVVRWIHAWTNVENDTSGRPIRLLGTCQDVTESRLAEHERERALEELKEADRQKDEFLAMLSHELRNPLAPILSAVEILRLADPSDRELSAKFRAIIERQVSLMKRLLDDLLDVARVSRGRIELRKERIDLMGVVVRAVEISRPLISEKKQRLAVTSGPGGTILVDADPTRLVQVFANLLNNAAKYTEGGGRIEVDISAADHDAVVRVRDNGIGMAPELLDRAFDLFVQATRSLDRAQGGLGIGLTMVRSLVRMHGGSVCAFSDGPGLGSELVVRLPRERAAVPAATESCPSRPVPSKASRPLRVLVVDDNLDAATSLSTLLSLIGHVVTLASDGPTALALVPAATPDLVLIDIGLPMMDGYALAAALRGAGLDRAALVAVTGYGRDDDVRRSREAGFDDHLVKPVDLATLQRITARQTDRRDSREAGE